MANKDKIIDKIEKKIDSIEKLHDKESMMCEEVKDLLADLRDQEEDEKWEDDSEEDFDEDNEFVQVVNFPKYIKVGSWKNKEEQRNLMVEYKMSKEEVDKLLF